MRVLFLSLISIILSTQITLGSEMVSFDCFNERDPSNYKILPQSDIRRSFKFRMSSSINGEVMIESPKWDKIFREKLGVDKFVTTHWENDLLTDELVYVQFN